VNELYNNAFIETRLLTEYLGVYKYGVCVVCILNYVRKKNRCVIQYDMANIIIRTKMKGGTLAFVLYCIIRSQGKGMVIFISR
jgi:hypothetical protein